MTTLLVIFAAITGSTIMKFVLTIIVLALICWLLWWLIAFIGIPEPFNKIARGAVAVLAVFALINELLNLTDRGGFIKW